MSTVYEQRDNISERMKSIEAIPPEQRGERASSVLLRDYNRVLADVEAEKIRRDNTYDYSDDFRGGLPPKVIDVDVVTYRDLLYLYQQILAVLPT